MFPGHIISNEGIEVNPKKTKAVKNCPRPFNPTDIRSFLGLARYYRRFVDEFASISSPLTTLTQRSVKFEWLEACERSFQILKDRLTSALVLTLPEGTKGFVVYCDAFQVGWGCIPIQHGKIVAYSSRQWLELLKDYNMSVLYRHVKANVVAYALSPITMGCVSHV